MAQEMFVLKKKDLFLFFTHDLFQVMDRQQYIVRPMVMDETTTNGSGSENPVVAGSSGVVSEAALAHAPTLTEQTLRERGIPLHQAIQQVRLIFLFFFLFFTTIDNLRLYYLCFKLIFVLLQNITYNCLELFLQRLLYLIKRSPKKNTVGEYILLY